MNVTVSIITPSYNSENYICKTIESVLKQSFSDFEMIIADDCSKDNTVSIIKKYTEIDKRVKLIELNKNGGAGNARNAALSMANGDFIAFLDSDDTWQKEKLEKQVNFMKENNYLFSFTSYIKVNGTTGEIEEKINAPSKVTYESALYKNPIGCLTAMYDRSVLGTQYFSKIRRRQDYALWLKILKITPGYGLNEFLSNYTNRDESISSNKLKLISYEWNIYRKEEQLPFLTSTFYLTTAILSRLVRIVTSKIKNLFFQFY